MKKLAGSREGKLRIKKYLTAKRVGYHAKVELNKLIINFLIIFLLRLR